MYKNTFENINFWRCHQFRKNACFVSHCLQWVLAVPFAKNSSYLGFWQHWRKGARERNTPSQIHSQQWLPGNWGFKVPPPGRPDCDVREGWRNRPFVSAFLWHSNIELAKKFVRASHKVSLDNDPWVLSWALWDQRDESVLFKGLCLHRRGETC